MTLYTYSSRYTDIGLGVLASTMPRMTVEPVEEAFGPNGLVAAVPVELSLTSGTGAFDVDLFPSGELTAAASGRVGVDYVIKVTRFEDDVEGNTFAGLDVYQFTAVAGGGRIEDMAGGSLLAVWIGPPWPAAPLPKGLYIDKAAPNPWGIVT